MNMCVLYVCLFVSPFLTSLCEVTFGLNPVKQLASLHADKGRRERGQGKKSKDT